MCICGFRCTLYITTAQLLEHTCIYGHPRKNGAPCWLHSAHHATCTDGWKQTVFHLMQKKWAKLASVDRVVWMLEKLDLRPNKRIIWGLKRHEMAQVSVHWEEYRSNVQSSRESQDNVFCNASTFWFQFAPIQRKAENPYPWHLYLKYQISPNSIEALHHQSVDLEGQTKCEPCDLGEAVNYTGALRCYKCPPGAAGQPLVSNQRGEGRENTNFEHVYVYTQFHGYQKKETYIAHDRRSTVLFYICFL